MKPKSHKNNQWQRICNGCNRWFIRLFKIHDLPVFILLVLVTAFLCVIAFPVAATIKTQHREHFTFVKSLVKPHPNPLLSKEREQISVSPLTKGGLRGVDLGYICKTEMLPTTYRNSWSVNPKSDCTNTRLAATG